jgi:uncharacterized protein YegP (UPF0339 family)
MDTSSAGRFQIYKDQKGEYRWRLRTDDDRIIADCSEGYVGKESCKYAIKLVKQLTGDAGIEDNT